MSRTIKLLRLIILRTIREERFLTVLSIVGVALGIGLFTGVKVASDRAMSAFETEIRGVNPAATHEILSMSGIGFDETLYPLVLQKVGACFPVMKATGYVRARDETIEINGIDTVKSLRFIGATPRKAVDIETFYRKNNAVLITASFAATASVRRGDTLQVLVYDREYSLFVADVLDSDALSSRSVIMDIGNFQELFGRTGQLTRIDLVADERQAAEISKILPGDVVLERKSELIRNQKAILSSFQYNLQFVSLISILVGVFLLYNTIFISVVKRRTEIGILRGLGADRKTIMFLFTLQGLIVGAVGSLLGIVIGQVFAYFSVLAVEKTISSMYSNVAVSDYLLTFKDWLKALVLGLSVSFLASLFPSVEASRIHPGETLREGSFEGRYRRYLALFSTLGFLSVIMGMTAAYVDYRFMPFPFPFLAYAGILLIILGFTLFSPSFLLVFLRLLRRVTGRLFMSPGRIALGDIRGSLYRFSVALMCVAISSALIVALLTLIFSFRASLKDWIDRNVSADVYVKPASCVSNYCFFPLSDDVVRTIEGLPDIGGIDQYRALQSEFLGSPVTVAFGNTELYGRYLETRFGSRIRPEELRALRDEGKVAVSDYLRLKHGLKAGDRIDLMTPKGKKTFTVSHSFMNYATTSGFIFMDRRWLKEYWGLNDATQISVYLREGADAASFIGTLKQQLPAGYALTIMNNRDLRDKILSIFNKSFAITYAIELIAILVSVIGVINILLALVLEKKRDISIIRYLGGSWRQIRATLTITAGIVGLGGITLGLTMGPILSIIFIHVINKISFGWEITFRVPVLFLSLVTAFLFVTILIAGIIPSRVAQKVDPKRFISFE